jgi:hypothetical protein
MYLDHYEGNALVKSTKAEGPPSVCARFVKVIKGEEEPLPLEYSLKLLRLQNAIIESGKKGKPVRLARR